MRSTVHNDGLALLLHGEQAQPRLIAQAPAAQPPTPAPGAGQPPATAQPPGGGRGRGQATFPAQQRAAGDPAIIQRGKTLYEMFFRPSLHGLIYGEAILRNDPLRHILLNKWGPQTYRPSLFMVEGPLEMSFYFAAGAVLMGVVAITRLSPHTCGRWTIR